MKIEFDINAISFNIDNHAIAFIKYEGKWRRCQSDVDDFGVPILSTYKKSIVSESDVKKELPKIYHHITYLPKEKSVLITVKEKKHEGN